MIKIHFKLDHQQAIKELEMTGHAGYAEAGEDIVCAAVSSQVISVENSLFQLLGIETATEINESQGGYLKITLPEISDKALNHDAQLLLRHLYFAYQVLAENYPEYIQLKESNYQP